MRLEKYVCQEYENHVIFTFESVGPRGIIKKVISYQSTNRRINDIPVINLMFGDWNEEELLIDDSIVSNNNDRDKVLATVASTVLSYLEKHGPCYIFAMGITPVKTRLYQMGLNANRQEIEDLFIINGLYKGKLEPFESGKNFDGFLILKK